MSLADDLPMLEQARLLKKRLEVYVLELMSDIFTPAYARKHSPPPCVKRFLVQEYPVKALERQLTLQIFDSLISSSEEEESEGEEKEFEFE